MNFEKFKELVKDWDDIQCEIEWTFIEWKITIENGNIFICQDKKDWDRCNDRKWYEYSWIIEEKVEFNDLSKIRLDNLILEWEEVYVSNSSIESALKDKNKRIFLYKTPWNKDYPFMVVIKDSMEEYKSWNDYLTTFYKYITKVKEIKEYTMEELTEKLGEKFKIVKK